MTTKTTVPEVMILVKEYYKENPVGGNLHIVLDDGNVKDSNVQFCLNQAEENGDVKGVELAKILLQMSKTQRLKLYADH